ncbi:ABC transporter ATP-binding protein/permease [Candidatus Saccharibacteria bacterium]|nr:ABC transporter ATP-binding protein/permease [Candidatus Saccharibacteria bacterium]
MSKKDDKSSVTKRTLYYYWQATKKHWLLAGILIITTPIQIFLMSYAGPFIIAQILNKLTTTAIAANQVFSIFGSYILLAILAIVAGRAISQLLNYADWKLEIQVEYELGNQTFDALANQSMHFHNDRFSGSLVSQTSQFIGAYERLVDILTYNLLPIVCSIVFITVILWPIVPLYVVILLMLVLAYTVISFLSFKKIAPLNKNSAAMYSKRSGQLSDSVSNIEAVKSYGHEKFERRLFDKASIDVQQADAKLMKASITRDSLFSIVIVGMIALVIIFVTGGHAWFGIGIGTLVMIFTYTQQMTGQLWSINSIFRGVNRSFGDAVEMTKILDEPQLVHDAKDAKPIKIKKGDINFNHIVFWHPDAKKSDKVFDDFTLHIPAGQRVGLVGRSGSGKTTLTKILLRFADVQSGDILIDGQDISRVTQISLRQNIAYVPQEPLLFHRSIFDNIAYGRPNATRDEVINAAKQANALEFIKDLPQGFSTLVGERGVKLSGGQRQRIAIARAILKDAPILVLDEATSALDSESEKLIQDALQTLMKGRTSIVVAHRLSTVAGLDRIIVLKNGKIVEDGTHTKLAKGKGEYAKLWNRQSGGFIER